MSATNKTGHSVFFHSLLISLSVGVGFIATPFGASAQESIVLDFSNPNVSVDLSVLEDSSAGYAGAASPSVPRTRNLGAASSKGYLAPHLVPGPKAPVSTLYIAPANSPATTAKFKFKFVAPEEPKEVAKSKATPKTKVVKKVVKKATPVAPPPPPSVTPVEVIKEKTAPELAKEEVAPPPEPAAIEKPKEIVKAEPEAPKAPPPPPEPAPAPAPVTPVIEKVVEKPVKLEAKPAEKAKEEQRIAEPVAPPPPPAVKVPAPPKVVAKLPEKIEEAPAIASLPPAGTAIGDGHSMRVLFEAENAKLPADAREELRELAASMINQEGLRLQLLAYAGGAKMSSSVARRLSLSRALAVRSYLIESGVRSTRIDVRALGNKTSDAETERVDITVIER